MAVVLGINLLGSCMACNCLQSVDVTVRTRYNLTDLQLAWILGCRLLPYYKDTLTSRVNS